MSVFAKQQKISSLHALILTPLVMSLVGCATYLPAEEPTPPEQLLQKEMPDAKVFSEMVSSYLEAVEKDFSNAP